MRNISLMLAASAILGLGASSAYAMCGSNLSPGRTPYAVLQPQTVAAAVTPAAPRPARLKATPPR
jgi:hypothetical protein